MLLAEVIEHEVQHWHQCDQDANKAVSGACSLFKTGDTVFDLTEVCADRVRVLFDAVKFAHKPSVLFF